MESQKKLRGCDEPAKLYKLRIFKEQEEFTRCPAKCITENTRMYFEAYHFYKQGFLPNGTSYLDEPAKLIEIFKFMDGFIGELEREERESQTERMRHGK